MKSTRILSILVVALGLMVWLAGPGHAGPVGTAFTCQGRLIAANSAADGEYDMQFKLYDAPGRWEPAWKHRNRHCRLAV